MNKCARGQPNKMIEIVIWIFNLVGNRSQMGSSGNSLKNKGHQEWIDISSKTDILTTISVFLKSRHRY